MHFRFLKGFYYFVVINFIQATGSIPARDFDPLSLPADKVHVDLEVGPSVLLLYGMLLKLLINLKVIYLSH